MIFRFETYSKRIFRFKASSIAEATEFFLSTTKYSKSDIKRIVRDHKAEQSFLYREWQKSRRWLPVV